MEQYAVFDLPVAGTTLDYMGGYFNFSYPLAKQGDEWFYNENVPYAKNESLKSVLQKCIQNHKLTNSQNSFLDERRQIYINVNNILDQKWSKVFSGPKVGGGLTWTA